MARIFKMTVWQSPVLFSIRKISKKKLWPSRMRSFSCMNWKLTVRLRAITQLWCWMLLVGRPVRSNLLPPEL